MKICFVKNGNLNSVWQNNLKSLTNNDVVVFGFNGLGLVSYKKELSGETEYFSDLAKLSKQLSCVIISGCDTDTYGIFRHSAVIGDKGKILGVSDMLHSIDDSEYVAGGNYRVYDTSAGKIGIIISEDIYFPESPRILSLCDADIIICVMKSVDNGMPQIMLRSGAFANGINMCLCAENLVTVADIKGNIKLFTRKDLSHIDLKTEKDYHLISCRRRGMYKEFNSGY
jgi:predicted amidohydrolase